jgi:hypothetical protein
VLVTISLGDKWFTEVGFAGCLIPLATEAQFQCLPNWYESCLRDGFQLRPPPECKTHVWPMLVHFTFGGAVKRGTDEPP